MTEVPRSVAGSGRTRPPDPAEERALIGRRHRLDTGREWLMASGSVLFFGPGEAGKSAALDVLAAAAIATRILRCTPARWGGQPFSCLSDLFSAVTPAELDSLPEARRNVLVAALEIRPESVRSSTQTSVRLAALNLVRILARSHRLLLVIDDIQWLDGASADALRFIARRVEDLPVQMAAAELAADNALPTGRGLCPPPLLTVRLDAVGTGDPQGRPGQGRQVGCAHPAGAGGGARIGRSLRRFES